MIRDLEFTIATTSAASKQFQQSGEISNDPCSEVVSASSEVVDPAPERAIRTPSMHIPRRFGYPDPSRIRTRQPSAISTIHGYNV
jgi:hypothetical protein